MESRMRAALAAAIIVLVAAILWGINEGSIKDTMRDLAMIVVGHVLSKFSGVYDFYFGSSSGSKEKTALMAQENASPLTDDMREK